MTIWIAALALLSSDPDGVVATASPETDVSAAVAAAEAPLDLDQAPVLRAGTQMSTADQIDLFLAPARAADAAEAARFSSPYGWVDDGLVHGQVNVGVGSDGYSTYGGAVSAPLGGDGRLTLRYQESEGGPTGWRTPLGYPQGRYLGYPPHLEEF